jgi:predicted GIY-YIG superfamily endonuclease
MAEAAMAGEVEAAVAAERASLAPATREAETARSEVQAPETAVWTLDRLRGRPLPEPQALVYMLAFARGQPYYVNVASLTIVSSSLANAYANRNAIYRIQKRRYGQERVTPLYLVYFEPHASYDAAVARCEHIWAMPHVWQRNLIERFNGEWLNVIDELIAFPCSTHYVGEMGLVACPEPAHAPSPSA